jgi:hypothetical protein
MIKLKAIKTLTKGQKKKKIKSRRTESNTLYIKIKHKWLN